jgi:Phage major capsid protein E
MPLIMDVFNNRAFNATELTEALNLVPNKYGRLEQLGLFVSRGVRTRTVALQINEGVINLLPSRPYGGTPSLGLPISREARVFPIPHFPHNDAVLAADVQDVIGFNLGSFDLADAQELINDKLELMSAKHFTTWEFMRWGALNGKIYDADGVLLLDLFAEFGIIQTVIPMNLTAAGLSGRLTALKRYYEDNLKGSPMSGIHVFASSSFWDALITNPDIIDYMKQYRGTAMLGVDYRNSFDYFGITFEEHNGRATDVNGGVHKFIPDGKALAVPMGTANIFRQYWAPADFMETVNRPGMTSMYAKQRRMDFDRGVEIHTQSNPLPMVARPELVPLLSKDAT